MSAPRERARRLSSPTGPEYQDSPPNRPGALHEKRCQIKFVFADVPDRQRNPDRNSARALLILHTGHAGTAHRQTF
jgi:hypothetical protein